MTIEVTVSLHVRIPLRDATREKITVAKRDAETIVSDALRQLCTEYPVQ
jgi:hypothetical protein